MQEFLPKQRSQRRKISFCSPFTSNGLTNTYNTIPKKPFRQKICEGYRNPTVTITLVPPSYPSSESTQDSAYNRVTSACSVSLSARASVTSYGVSRLSCHPFLMYASTAWNAATSPAVFADCVRRGSQPACSMRPMVSSRISRFSTCHRSHWIRLMCWRFVDSAMNRMESTCPAIRLSRRLIAS